METLPYNFIDEQIEVIFDQPPVLEKSPTCPDGFIWRKQTFQVEEMLETWINYQRRGRFERNMRLSHRIMAAKRGSWGVGRFHFRVRVEGGRVFELYYDRAPESAGDRKGHWFLLGERRAAKEV